MNASQLRLPGTVEGVHPAVFNRRVSDGVTAAAAALVSIALALAITLEMGSPNYALFLAAVIGLIALAALLASPRLDLTVGGLVFFLGCINGPFKLISSAGTFASAVQDVLIIAVLLGLLLRRLAAGSRWRVPPLSGWVIAFVAVVVLEAFNPDTLNVLKVFAGFREQLQFVPFFLFGYLLMRSKKRLRKAFLLLGVIALANGITSTYQTRLSPSQAASWGAGYEHKFSSSSTASGPGAKDAKTYKSEKGEEGEAHVRPTALGDESGSGAGTGLIALAGTLALLATTRRKRGLLLLLTLGALAAIATGLGRIELAGGVLSVVGYALFTATAGRKARRPLRYLFVVALVVIPAGAIFVSTLGEGTFSRYSSLFGGGSGKTVSYKENELRAIPKEASAAPFGFGLGTAGPATGFGGKETEQLEGHDVNAETTYNFIFKEVGIPGIIVWSATIVTMLLLAFSRIRTIADPELQTYLAAVFAPVFAMFFMTFYGPVSQSQVLAPFFWFALGVEAWWLAGAGWRMARRRLPTALAPRPAGTLAT